MSIRRAVTALSTAALMAVTALGVAPTALAKGGEVGGSGNEFFLSNSFGTRADVELTYGSPGDDVFVGDWDGDGTDTLAVRRGAQFHVRNTNTSGGADRAFVYGRPGDVVLVGDWDGDGTDTLAVRRGAVYHVKNSLTGGPADQEVAYGRAADTVLVGDWDGDGDDTFAVRRGAQYFVKNTIAPGSADQVVVYGRTADDVYVGDFDGDRRDSFTVRRGAQYFVSNTVRPGSADREVVYGRPDDTTLVGDWDGDGVDTLGVRRAAPTGGALAYDQEMVELINGYRAEHGVAPLRFWDELREGALTHSRRMAANGSFQHASTDRIAADAVAAGCSGGYGENIFWSSGHPADPEIAMDGYMNSPGHRANILRESYGYVATGTIFVDGVLHNTQRFAGSCR